MFSNWQYRLLALVLALSCWYIVTGREKVETWAEMPVEIVGAPEDLAVRGDVPTRVRARIRGSRALIRRLNEQPPVYTLDLSMLTPGENGIALEKEDIPVSMALEVMEIDPSRLVLTADTLISATLPVRPVWRGGPGEDFDLTLAEAAPAEVVVRGPEPLVLTLKDIPTLEREVPGSGAGEHVFETGLALPKGVSSETAKVGVRLEYALKTKSVWIRLPVRVLPESVNGRKVTLVPRTIQIQAVVPLPLLREKEFKSLFSVSVVAPGSLKSGKHVLPVTIKAPDGCTLLKTVPEKVEVRIKKG
ncbi:YbbR-like domain-containing protein [Desulfovibrio ferrophilus]|uniref:YbbR family protein n=1 Tax=Desulfovibrio ferrophilus TaxID=241368 RepID=A0A2Z6AUU4_9BACT|nr:hypothetical protein [Desulfovibrio ferrophilus]BBD07001.1 YbbR family protein [Desulfovibrio ferrophilus]